MIELGMDKRFSFSEMFMEFEIKTRILKVGGKDRW